MAVTTNGAAASSAIGLNLTGGTAATFNYTCPVGTDCLALVEGNVSSTSQVGAPPTAVTYNGVALTMVPGSESNSGTLTGATSIWYLKAPPTGSSLVVSVTYADTLNIQATVVQPLIGVNQSAPVGTAAVATATSTAAAVTAPGGVAGDLYIGSMQSSGGSTSVSGGSQTSLAAVIERGSNVLSLDDAAGSGTGAFSWTVANGAWYVSAVAFKATASASPVIPSGLGFFGSGPGPRGPFNNNQFRSFPFSALPLSANAWVATLAEAGGAVDSLTSAQVMLASLTEAGAATDTVTVALAMSLALAEAGAAADSLVSVAAFASSLSTAGAATDALTSTWAAVAALAEAGSALDAYVNALAMSASLTEAGAAADSVANGSLYTATLAEAGTAADSATAVSVLSASLAEAGTAAAAINATLTAALALSEAASAVDALGLSVNLNASVSEAGAALDAFVTALTFNAALLEAGFALDALAANQSSGSLFPTRLLTTGFYTQLLASQAGALPYGEFFTYKGDVLVYGIDWAGFLANYWQRGGLVAANFAIRPTSPTGFQLATVLGGQSGSTEPACPTTIGQTVQDGSVLWVCQAVDTTSLSATVASVTWAPAVGITVATQSIAGQLTIAKIDASAATAGQKYAVDAHVLMSDGETKTGRIVLKVS